MSNKNGKNPQSYDVHEKSENESLEVPFVDISTRRFEIAAEKTGQLSAGELDPNASDVKLVQDEVAKSAFEPLTKVERVARRPYGAPDDPAKRRFPNMFSWMTAREYPSGKTRDVARMSIVATETGFKVSITDYDQSMACDAESDTLEGLFKALEAKWSPGATGWRECRSGKGYERRRSKERRDLEGKPEIM